MSVIDSRRLPVQTFKLDVDRMRRGWYSDKYFESIVNVLTLLSKRGYRFGGVSERLSKMGVPIRTIDTGDIRVEMQWFTRRQPFSIIGGVDKCLAMLKECTGYFDVDGHWVATYDQLEVEAVRDGFVARYDGDPIDITPIIRVRGRYRDFGLLETPTLGTLTRSTRIATNVYEVLRAARGKQVLFFPARFDAHEIQAGDGYAYHVAVQVFNKTFGRTVPSIVSTDEQGDWWGGAGGGTVAHAAIACFLGDTAETMLAVSSALDPEVPRIALVDFNNDCVGESQKSARAMLSRYMQLVDSGDHEQARRFVLFGVRLDTSSNMIDKTLAGNDPAAGEFGVNPSLVRAVRQALDTAYTDMHVPAHWCARAREYCQRIKITVSGGFTPAKIRVFEDLHTPVDVYGVGSVLFSNSPESGTNNDFTADVVRVCIDNTWYDMAKEGRRANENPALEPVVWSEI